MHNKDNPIPAPRKRRSGKVALGIVGVLVGVGVIAAVAGGPTVPDTAPLGAAGSAAVPDKPAAAKPTKPDTFGDGMYLVGTDLPAGSYKSTGPRPGGVDTCYWARHKDDSGLNIKANSLSAGPARFTARKGEYVEITGCDFVAVR